MKITVNVTVAIRIGVISYCHYDNDHDGYADSHNHSVNGNIGHY